MEQYQLYRPNETEEMCFVILEMTRSAKLMGLNAYCREKKDLICIDPKRKPKRSSHSVSLKVLFNLALIQIYVCTTRKFQQQSV